MEKEIIVAIVTAFASLVVAVISLVSSITTSRNSINAAKSLEKYKFNTQLEMDQRKRDESAFIEIISSIKAGVQAIQHMKDEIYLILSSSENSLSSTTAQGRIQMARENLFETYEKNHIVLNDLERRIFHNAKTTAMVTDQKVRGFLNSVQYASEISLEGMEFLKTSHAQLSEFQSRLRDRLMDRITERITNDQSVPSSND